MATDDRPSWIADTLSDADQPITLAEEIAALGAEVDHLDALLRLLERESEPPEPDPPMPALAQAA
jgi:hypothetical protein